MKPASLLWCRLRSVAVIAAAKEPVVRSFVADQIGFEAKLKSLDNLETAVLHELNHTLSTISNETLEEKFLEFVRGRS